ncbi:T9SS type A sorting domain-containing protein [bacterium]|nr:T9SS type A sorting domain-containing protein [bacterium]
MLILALQTGLHAEDAKYKQQSENGLVVMEAENYTGYDEPNASSFWDATDEPSGYSGTGAMEAFPGAFNDNKDLTTAQSNAPVLQYSVVFISADPLYLWGRASHVDGYDDSVWYGLDGEIYRTDPLSYTTDEQEYSEMWYWIHFTMSGAIAMLDIGDAGIHVFEMVMREPGFKLDKLLLTTNAEYVPEGMGPDETLSGGTVVQDVSAMPGTLVLAQNYPNPFNPLTTIQLTIPASGQTMLQIYNISGQLVETVMNTRLNAGVHRIEFDAPHLQAGVCFCKVHSDPYSAMNKMILMKQADPSKN